MPNTSSFVSYGLDWPSPVATAYNFMSRFPFMETGSIRRCYQHS